VASFTLQLDSPSTVSFEGKFLDFSSTTTAIFLVQDSQFVLGGIPYPGNAAALVLSGYYITVVLPAGVYTIGEDFTLPGPHLFFANQTVSSFADPISVRVATGPAAGLTAHDDAYVTIQGQPSLAPTYYGVLTNDVSASPATATLLSGTSHGSLQFSNNGTFVYTPNAGFAGIDTFTYRAQSGLLTSDATATIYVAPVNVGATTTLDLLALTAQEQIASMYLIFFGRGPDLAGFEFWINQFETGLQTQGPAVLFANIANSFAISAEAKALYPLLVNPSAATDSEIGQFLNAVYNNIFNRAPEPAGAAFWTAQLKAAIAAGQPVGNILIDLVSGTQNSGVGQDITTLMSKIAVSLKYVQQQEEQGASWTLAENGAQAVTLVSAVTSEPLTVLTGTANADKIVARSSSLPSAASVALTSENIFGNIAPAFLTGDAMGVTTMVQPGSNTRQTFDMGHGDQLDLTQVLAGANLRHDLTNIADFVKVIGYGSGDPGSAAGATSMLEIMGPNGSATIALEASGRLTVDDLVKNNALVLPPY
jgi:hypothetical protein